MSASSADLCPICGGHKEPGTTTYAVDIGTGVVVVRNVPATVCQQCGEAWIADEIAEQLEARVADAREKKLQVEVVAM
jgi:YgiT-type zinc finger domain-containing protein